MKKVFIYVNIFLLLCCCLSSVAFADSDGVSTVPETSEDLSSYRSEVTVESLRISPSDTSGLHAILLSLIGDYNSIVKDYTYITTSYNGSQTTNHVVEITPDYSWIATALLFIVIIYCCFRLVGAIFSGKV